MKHEFKVKRILKGRKTEETGPISGPNAFKMALEQASFWGAKIDTKHVTILRADKEGINAGKFFLHQIVK